MKIDANDAGVLRPDTSRGTTPSSPSSVSARGDDASPGAATGTAPGAALGKSADQLQLTPDSQLLMEARESLAAVPDVDSGRVTALREQIAAGEFPIDPLRIATRMLDFERNL